MKLLIVEDDADAAGFMQYVLEQERFSVRSAGNVAEAKSHLQDCAPDLIILDRGMPDADGLDFCRELKGHARFGAIPVIFVSVAKTPADIADGFAAGGDDYITKPFAFIELIARVHSLLRRAGADASS